MTSCNNFLPIRASGCTRLLKSAFAPLPRRALGFCYDSGHENAFTPTEDYLSQYGDILVAMHLHDNNGQSDGHLPPLHPSGTVNWERKVAQLKQTALFGRMITLEANLFGKDLLEGFSASLAAAKRLAEM